MRRVYNAVIRASVAAWGRGVYTGTATATLCRKGVLFMSNRMFQGVVHQMKEAIDRTHAVVGEGLEAANAWFAQNQAEKETALGIR